MTLLALTTGLRACDILALRLADIDWRGQTIGIVQQKTSNPLTFPLPTLVTAKLADYVLNERPSSETHGAVAKRLTTEVLAMSPATIDRYLAPTKAARYPAAKSATRPSATLLSGLTVRKAMDPDGTKPRVLRGRPGGACGHSLQGEHAWSLTAIDVFTRVDSQRGAEEPRAPPATPTRAKEPRTTPTRRDSRASPIPQHATSAPTGPKDTDHYP